MKNQFLKKIKCVFRMFCGPMCFEDIIPTIKYIHEQISFTILLKFFKSFLVFSLNYNRNDLDFTKI